MGIIATFCILKRVLLFLTTKKRDKRAWRRGKLKRDFSFRERKKMGRWGRFLFVSKKKEVKLKMSVDVRSGGRGGFFKIIHKSMIEDTEREKR